ncbi:carbohydrate ABC transporter permease [Pseudactinotalea sp. Z1739]|uniref:carbohydrate ABC transporter permease n=1 Tax=Pseudactinotalea sp. Z1739 TaxID=3413028 RepID=UPI003C7A2223
MVNPLSPPEGRTGAVQEPLGPSTTALDTGLRRGRKSGTPRRQGHAYVFLLPWILGLTLITLGPLLAALYLSFTNYNLLSSPDWIGLANYRRMFFSDTRFINSLIVTFTYVFVSVPLQLVFALFVALTLNKGMRGLALYRSIYYLPSLLGGSVAIAVLWRQVFRLDGVVNSILEALGFSELPSWIADPSTALGTLIVLNVWTFGSPMIIFLAGLRQIPEELYEAASIDGVGVISRLFYVTLPLLTPMIFFNIILQVIGAFQAFTPAYVVSGGTGGPADSTLFYTLYLYERGFVNFEMGYASALGWILLLIIGGLTALNFYSSKHWVHYNE